MDIEVPEARGDQAKRNRKRRERRNRKTELKADAKKEEDKDEKKKKKTEEKNADQKDVKQGGKWASLGGATVRTKFDGKDTLSGSIDNVEVDFDDPKWEEKLTDVYMAALQKILAEHNSGPQWSLGQAREWVAHKVHLVRIQHEAEERKAASKN